MTSINDRTGRISSRDLIDDINAEAGIDITQQGGGGGLSSASSFTTTTLPEYLPDGPEMTVIVLPDENEIALAIAIEGDTTPRVMISANGLFLGSGTDGNDLSLVITSSTLFGSIISCDGETLVTTLAGDLRFQGSNSIVLLSENGTAYRLVVADNGTLSTTPV